MQQAGFSDRARALGARVALALGIAVLAGGPVAAQGPADGDLIPDQRVVLMEDVDLPGSDLTQIFDVTAESCLKSCLDDDACQAVTYNQTSRACFPKDDLPQAQPFSGALSGHVVTASPEIQANAKARADAADFLAPDDLKAAFTQAQRAATSWPPRHDPEPRTNAWQAEFLRQWDEGLAIIGALVADEDQAADWVMLARIANGAKKPDIAALAAINGYLRADEDSIAARALGQLGQAWDTDERGRDSLAALRLAVSLSNDQTLAAALTRAEERYGMRVTEHEVETDSDTPALCVTFSRELSEAVDYAPYLRLPSGDLTINPEDQNLCIKGFEFGSRIEITLRKGLPAGDGETLAQDVELAALIPDRDPAIRFPGRAYVLPSTGDRGIEVATVNTDSIDLRLMQVSDRNLIASMRNDLFARPLDRWSAQWLNDEMATEIWTGAADVAGAGGDPADLLNREVTTRLGIPDEAGPLAPGVYVLQASLPGEDVDDYYGDTEQVAAQWFVLSDFGISSLWGTDSLTVVVRGLSDAGPREGVEVALVSRANAVLTQVATDAEGVAVFDAGIARGEGAAAPAMITVTEWEGEGTERTIRDMAFLSLTEPEFDLSDRGVEGLPSPGPIDLFLTTDRGIYRAGEVVHVTAMARDSAAKAIDDLPLTAILTRPDGVEARNLRVQPVAAGGYVFDLPIDASAPRGTWRLDMRTGDKGPPLASTRILVEDFLPERIDFDIDLLDRPLQAGAEVTLDNKARWLFGAPASGLPYEAWLRLANGYQLPGFDNYHFGNNDGRTPTQDNIASGMTDADGGFSISAQLPESDRLQEATFRIQVSEGAGRPVERTETRTLLPDNPLPGIRPLFEGDTVSEGSEARFSLIAIEADEAGTLQPVDLPARWVLTRLEDEYIWYRSGDRWDWEVVTHRKRLTGDDITIRADRSTELALPVDWGRYELRIEPSDPAHAGQGVATTTFWSGWAMASSGTESPDRLTMRLDQESYRSGDTARATIEATEDGIGLVSVLTNRVVDLITVDLKTGANEVEIPVTDAWGAGAYVTVSAIRPLDDGDAQASREPARRLGLAYAPVDPGPRKLDAEITIGDPDQPGPNRPRGVLPVTLSVKDRPEGEAIHATIAVIDQGILNLTSFKSPAPENHYFGQHRLGVGLRDLYGRLLLSTGAADGTLREGGDAQGSVDMSAPPPTEVLMAYFSGPVEIGPDGTARVDVPVPDFNGEVRAMAVLWGEDAIGQAEAKAQISDPVVMTVTAPQFLAPGDQSRLELKLTQAEGAGESHLTAEAQSGGLVIDTDNLPDSVTLAEGEAQSLTLPISIPSAAPEGIGQLQLALTAPDGALLTKDITIPIIDGTPEIPRRTRITVTPGTPLQLDGQVTADLRNVSQITLTAGPLASLDLASVLGGLARYPYGCTEQIASAALPLIQMPKLAAMVLPERARDEDSDPTETVQKTITRILNRQDSEGAFGMWSAGQGGDTWLNAHSTEFLSMARAAGYEVPDKAWQMAIDNLRNAVNYATSPASADRWENSGLAYATLVLARERAASIGDLRYYADAAGDAFKTPLSAAQIAASLALYGDNERAEKMLGRAFAQLRKQEAEDDSAIRWDYGSRLRDRAAVLALALETGLEVDDLDAEIRRIGEAIDQRRRRGIGLSTQDSGWLVRLAAAMMAAPPALSIDGQPITEVIHDLDDDHNITIEATGDQSVDITLTAFGRPAADEPAGGTGYRITRSFTDMEGEAVDIASVPLGTRLVAVVEVTPEARNPGGRLIIDDPLPAGFEIENPNLLTSGSETGPELEDILEDPDMAEFRQDRFLASVIWTSEDSFKLAYVIRAVHVGEFNHPAAMVEDMYRPEQRAWTHGGKVVITE